MIKPRQLWPAALVLLGISAWLMLHFPHNSLWYDEALTTWVATDSWQNLFRWCTQVDIQVPLHYIVLRFWTVFAGDSEFSLRLLSAFCVILASAGLLAATRYVTKNRSAGNAAALIFATLPGMLWLGYEVRAYALALALYAWATAFLVRLLDDKPVRRWWIVVYALLMIGTLYTHYTAIAGLAAHVTIMAAILLMRRSKRLLIRSVVMFVLVAIGFAPWLPIMLTRSAADRSYYEGQPIMPTRTTEVTLGFKLQGREDASDAARPLVIGYGLLMLAGSFYALRSRRWTAALTGITIALWPLAMTAVLVYFKPKLAGRYIWPAWVGFDLLAGLFVLAIMRWQRVIGAGVLIALLALPWLIGDRGHPPDSDFRSAYDYICSHGNADDLIALRDGTLFVVDAYYGRRPPCNTPRKTVHMPVAEMTNVEQALTYNVAYKTFNSVLSDKPRNVWVVSWQGDVMEPQALTYGLLETTGKHTVAHEMFGDVRIDRFEDVTAPPELAKLDGQHLNLTPVPDGPTLQLLRLIAPETVKAGDVIVVQAWWVRGKQLQPALRVSPRIMTLDGGWTYTQLDQPPSSWKYIDDRWTAGEPVLGRYELTVGADVPPGKQAVRINIYDANGRFEPIILTVGEITVR